MDELKRHRRVFSRLHGLFDFYLRHKFNYEYDSLAEIEGPYLLLANHNMELDPVSVSVAAKNHLYFVASEHVMRKGFLTKLLMYFFKPIIHKKGQLGISSVKDVLRTIKSGSSVCIFAEGERSFNGLSSPIQPSTGKLARSCGVPLVTYRLEGGYLTQPRWSTTLRKGRLRGRLVHVYTPQELRGMSVDEVNEAIKADLYEDAYAAQSPEPVAYTGKKLAYGLESAVFVCPKCGRIGLKSDKRSLVCGCGWKADYDVYGLLTDGEGKKYTVTELDAMQREKLRGILSAADNAAPLFSDSVRMITVGKEHEISAAEDGLLTAYPDHIEFCGHSAAYDTLDGMAIYSRNSLVLHLPEEHYEFKADISFCALKYLYLYKIVKGEI